MTNFEKLCPLILFATTVCMNTAHATSNAPAKDETKEESSATKVGKAVGKTEKKAEHGYKKHILKPAREAIKGTKEGHKEQKGKK